MTKTNRSLLILLILATIAPFALILTSLNFGLFESDRTVFWSSLAFKFAAFCGYAGAMLFIWQIGLGIRFLVQLITDDLVWVNKLHQWIGKYGVLLVIMHPLLILYTYGENWLWLVVPKNMSELELHISFGRFAFQIFLLIYLTSALIRSRLRYRPWKYLHLLVYPMMGLVFLHALDLGSNLEKYPSLKALWFTLLSLYLVLLIFRVLMWAGWFKPKYRLAELRPMGGDVWILKLQPSGKHLKPLPGQYFNLQFRPFGEAHPFSVLDYDPQSGDLAFGIKAVGSFTRRIQNLKPGDPIRLDGPYGVFTRQGWNHDRPKVLIAGGIGITPFYTFLKQYADARTYLLYCNFKLQNAVVRQAMKNILGDRYYDFLSDDATTGENIINSRISQEQIAAILQRGGLDPKDCDFFVCGSPALMKAVKAMLKGLGAKPDQIYSEEFSY